MLSILQIVHDHPVFTSGGTEVLAADLASALRAAGAEVRLLAATTARSRPEDAPGSLGRIGADALLRIGGYDSFSMTRRDGSAWTAALGTLLDEARPDIVHLHGLDRIGVESIALIRRRRPRARIVLTLHDFQLICAREGLMVTAEGALCEGASADACRRCLPELAAARHALRRAHLLAALAPVDLFLAPSRLLRERFIAWGLPADRVRLMPNAVPEAPAPLPPSRSDRFAFFGNLVPHKGALVLLEAAARLAQGGCRARISVHGGFTWEAPEERAAFAAALEAARPVAQHLGPYARGEVHAMMQAADWIVVPSTWAENAPLVILEAQRAGRPVICTGTGGMAELVTHGVDGLHVARGDAAALADTIAAVAGDAALCRRLAANIKPPQEPGTFAEAHLALYESLLERTPA